MKASIEKDRARIVRATLNRLKNNARGHYILVSMPDGDLQTITVDEDFVNNMLHQLEAHARNKCSKAEADEVITESYDSAVIIEKGNEYLTAFGEKLMDALFEKKVKSIKEKYRANGISNGLR